MARIGASPAPRCSIVHLLSEVKRTRARPTKTEPEKGLGDASSDRETSHCQRPEVCTILASVRVGSNLTARSIEGE
jgi:hypothetical protein